MNVNADEAHTNMTMRVDELTRLNALNQSALPGSNLKEVLTRIVYEATRMLSVETGSVLLLNEETSELSFDVSVLNDELIDIPARLKVGQGFAGWVAATGEAVCINDVTQDKRWFGEMHHSFNTRSIVCVPLQTNGRVLGVLQILNKKDEVGFDQTDVIRLSAFAISATIAIERARLHQEASQARQLRTLNDIAVQLSRSLNLETVLNTSLSEALRAVQADAGAVILGQGREDIYEINTQVGYGLADPPANTRQQAVFQSLTELIFEGELDDLLILSSADILNYPVARPLFPSGIQTVCLLPLKMADQVKGGIAILWQHADAAAEETANLLTGIARIMCLAAQNAIQHSQIIAKSAQLTSMNEIGTALSSSLEVVKVLEVYIKGVNTLLGTERTSVFLIDEETEELVLRYSNQGDDNIRLPKPWQGIAGWVATHDQPEIVNDTTCDPRFDPNIPLETGFEVRSILCIPLKIEDKIIGVAESLNKKDNKPFTLEHQSLLTELSRWAAIAIQNARLYEERIQVETRGAMADLVLNMAHTMNNIVGAIRVWAADLETTTEREPDKPLSYFRTKLIQIHDNAEEALDLISNIREPLENLSSEIVPTDILTCLYTAIQRLYCPEEITIELSNITDLPLVWASNEGLEAIFFNLISNAVQALGLTGGEIKIMGRLSKPGWAEIIIRDNGPGIPMPLQARIYEPGTSSKQEKLGIGLWLVESFVRRFKGQILFNTSADVGTTFRVLLRTVDTDVTLDRDML